MPRTERRELGAPARLGLYGAMLVAVFVVSFVIANVAVPDSVSTADDGAPSEPENPDPGHSNPENPASEHPGSTDGSFGLSRSAAGYQLSALDGPDRSGEAGTLSFTLTGPDGMPVTDYRSEHEKELHLIVTRTDGQHFDHVHPERAKDGTWSIPWEWQAGGSYRIYTDFAPTGHDGSLTLSSLVEVAGDYSPVPAEPASRIDVDGYRVSVDGDLVPGQPSRLTLSVARDGQPVTALQPYLGAFGHLVTLREGDLAYLHAHPQGAAPRPGTTSGPTVEFETTVPTEGRYLLHFDFQVDGQVHSAPLVIDTVAADHSDQEYPPPSEPGDDDHGHN